MKERAKERDARETARSEAREGGDREDRRRARGGDRRAVGACATRDGTASRGDAQSRPSQSSADIRAITLSTVLKISVLVPCTLARSDR